MNELNLCKKCQSCLSKDDYCNECLFKIEGEEDEWYKEVK